MRDLVNKVTNLVKRKRRRFNKSSTNANIVCQSFKIDVQKTLFIFTFINDYNHHIRNVDLVNQYKVTYETYKLIKRN